MEYAIFDMDGTLIDSMPAWHRLGEDYLRAKGITPPEDLHEQIKAMTMLECGEYARALGVPGTAAQIAGELTAQIERQYRELIPAREGVKEYLSRCRSAGVRMCVATATDSALANQCLARLGLLGYFEFLVSCEDIGKTKTSPDIYLLAAERLGACPSECVVFEDVLYPAETAARAGFPVAGVYDPASGEGNAQSLRAFCGAFIEDWRTAAFPPL
ncbi:MAG: HAD family phosphatase [Clostridiaceae bacterium]|nr:HAD family phosphatase [Clostridiaceae bacterium]